MKHLYLSLLFFLIITKGLFAQAPALSGFTPAIAGNGTAITITGTNFTNITSVSFGGTPAKKFAVMSSTSIIAFVDAGNSGNVSVTNISGTGSLSGFVFIPAPNISYSTPQVYSIGTSITPLTPSSTGGAIPATIYGQTTTFAGTGAVGSSNSTALNSSFNSPTRLAPDLAGNVFIADRNNNLIRKVSTTGVVTTFASGDFNQPNGVAVDFSGNVFVADAASNSVKKVTPAGVVTTLAGGTQGNANGTGTAASFYYPYSITIDILGNLYVGDNANHLVRKVTPTGVVTTVAGTGFAGFANGTGTSASFNGPDGISIDAAGNLYLADSNNNRIRKITPAGVVTTIAGNGAQATVNGPAASASFNIPAGAVIDAVGNIYVADLGGNTIRKIDPLGIVSTIAGNGTAGFTNGIGLSATFNRPNDVQIDPTGYVYVTDYGNNVIRKICTTGYYIDKPLPPGLTFDQTTGIISGTPTAASPATTYTITAYNLSGSSTTTVNITVIGGPPPNISYQTPQNYKVGTTISPLAPVNIGGPVAVASTVFTFAGGRAPVTFDGVGNNAGFNLPSGLASDATGNIYVSDYGSGAIRKITPSAVVTTINNVSNPSGLAIDKQGNFFVTDFEYNYVYKINPAGVKSIFAGNGSAGSANGSGSSASFYGPGGIIADASGNLYLADQQNNMIRKITNAGLVSTIAGKSGQTGVNDGPIANAVFNNPDGVCIDSQGNIYVADTKNNIIRKISTAGIVSTFAGNMIASSVDATGSAASFNYPTGLAIDVSDNLYVADYKNNQIRKITPAGVVTTVAGSGAFGSANGVGRTATFNNPLNLTFDPSGDLYVADFANNLVRKIIIAAYTIDKPLPPGLVFDPATGIISGTPTTIFPVTTYTITAHNTYGTGTATLVIGVTSIVAQTITFPALGSVVYGAANFNASATSTNSTIPITYASNNTSVATVDAGGTINITGVGQTAITASQAGNATYSAATPVSQVLTVTPATINVAVNNQTKVYGAANPVFTVNYTGFVYNETASVITKLPSIITTATVTSPVGTYPINGSGATAANYIFTYTAGTLTITPAPLLITANNQTRIYGVANPPLTLTYTGFITGDDATKFTIQPIVTTTATITSPVGAYPIIASGANNPNYTVTYAPGALTITVAPRVLTFGPLADKTFGDADFDPGATINTNDLIIYASSDPTIASIINGKVHILMAGTVIITATVAPRANYADVAPQSQTLVIIGDLVRITPVVTPNGDNINDVLRIDGIANYPDNRFTLVNINGVKVFEIDGYDNVGNVFDGHSNITGIFQPKGTYFYTLQFNVHGQKQRKVGYVVLKY